jgi:hypothetical protein
MWKPAPIEYPASGALERGALTMQEERPPTPGYPENCEVNA